MCAKIVWVVVKLVPIPLVVLHVEMVTYLLVVFAFNVQKDAKFVRVQAIVSYVFQDIILVELIHVHNVRVLVKHVVNKVHVILAKINFT